MELNYKQFQKVIDDLEDQGAAVKVLAHINTAGRRWDTEKEIEYTIEARFPTGKIWEVIEIQEGG